jgi:hypothetical protein
MEDNLMGKNNSRRRNHKPFNPIRNVEKLHELRPKLRKLESDNNGRGPKASSPPSEEKKKENFLEKDREIVLHVRKLFSKNGEMAEYREDPNAIILSIKGDYDIHPLSISCHSSVLQILSVKKINANNISNADLKYIMHLNFKILMGNFCYIPERECFVYYLSVPLYEKPEKEFVESIIKYTVDVLDDYVPEIISCIHEANHWKKENRSPTFH